MSARFPRNWSTEKKGERLGQLEGDKEPAKLLRVSILDNSGKHWGVAVSWENADRRMENSVGKPGERSFVMLSVHPQSSERGLARSYTW